MSVKKELAKSIEGKYPLALEICHRYGGTGFGLENAWTVLHDLPRRVTPAAVAQLKAVVAEFAASEAVAKEKSAIVAESRALTAEMEAQAAAEGRTLGSFPATTGPCVDDEAVGWGNAYGD